MKGIKRMKNIFTKKSEDLKSSSDSVSEKTDENDQNLNGDEKHEDEPGKKTYSDPNGTVIDYSFVMNEENDTGSDEESDEDNAANGTDNGDNETGHIGEGDKEINSEMGFHNVSDNPIKESSSIENENSDPSKDVDDIKSSTTGHDESEELDDRNESLTTKDSVTSDDLLEELKDYSHDEYKKIEEKKYSPWDEEQLQKGDEDESEWGQPIAGPNISPALKFSAESVEELKKKLNLPDSFDERSNDDLVTPPVKSSLPANRDQRFALVHYGLSPESFANGVYVGKVEELPPMGRVYYMLGWYVESVFVQVANKIQVIDRLTGIPVSDWFLLLFSLKSWMNIRDEGNRRLE